MKKINKAFVDGGIGGITVEQQEHFIFLMEELLRRLERFEQIIVNQPPQSNKLNILTTTDTGSGLILCPPGNAYYDSNNNVVLIDSQLVREGITSGQDLSTINPFLAFVLLHELGHREYHSSSAAVFDSEDFWKLDEELAQMEDEADDFAHNQLQKVFLIELRMDNDVDEFAHTQLSRITEQSTQRAYSRSKLLNIDTTFRIKHIEKKTSGLYWGWLFESYKTFVLQLLASGTRISPFFTDRAHREFPRRIIRLLEKAEHEMPLEGRGSATIDFIKSEFSSYSQAQNVVKFIVFSPEPAMASCWSTDKLYVLGISGKIYEASLDKKLVNYGQPIVVNTVLTTLPKFPKKLDHSHSLREFVSLQDGTLLVIHNENISILPPNINSWKTLEILNNLHNDDWSLIPVQPAKGILLSLGQSNPIVWVDSKGINYLQFTKGWRAVSQMSLDLPKVYFSSRVNLIDEDYVELPDDIVRQEYIQIINKLSPQILGIDSQEKNKVLQELQKPVSSYLQIQIVSIGTDSKKKIKLTVSSRIRSPFIASAPDGSFLLIHEVGDYGVLCWRIQEGELATLVASGGSYNLPGDVLDGSTRMYLDRKLEKLRFVTPTTLLLDFGLRHWLYAIDTKTGNSTAVFPSGGLQISIGSEGLVALSNRDLRSVYVVDLGS